MTRSWIFRLALVVMCVGAVGRVFTRTGTFACLVFDDLLALGSAIVFCTLVVEFWPTHRRPPTVRGAVDAAWQATKARRAAVRELAGLLPDVALEDAHELFVDLRGLAWSVDGERLVVMGTTSELHSLTTRDGITFAHADLYVYALDPLLNTDAPDAGGADP